MKIIKIKSGVKLIIKGGVKEIRHLPSWISKNYIVVNIIKKENLYEILFKKHNEDKLLDLL